jgi:hypothetical protein
MRDMDDIPVAFSNRAARWNTARTRKKHALWIKHMKTHPNTAKAPPEVIMYDALRLLERVTAAGVEQHTKRAELIRLPDGIRAVFKGSAAQAIAEIMQRTDSHVQILQPNADNAQPASRLSTPEERKRLYCRGFNSLILYGTPLENDAAMGILPSMVLAVSKDGIDASDRIGAYEVDTVSDGTKQLEQSLVDAPASDLPGEVLAFANAGTGTAPSVGHDELATPPYNEHEGTPLVDVAASDKSAAPDTLTPLGGQRSPESQHANSTTVAVPKDTNASLEKQRMTPTGPLRAVWTEERSFESRLSARLQEKGPGPFTSMSQLRPAIDSSLTFTAYVADLTTVPPRLLRLKLARGYAAPSLFDEVKIELLALFENHDMAPLVSQEAVDQALTFFIRVEDYKAMRTVLTALENNRHYTITASNYETMLAAAAKHQDLHNFRTLVRTMVRKEVTPTWRAWVLLHDLACRRFPKGASDDIAQRMKSRGILEIPAALRQTVSQAIDRDFAAYLNHHPIGTVDAFMKRYDETYGVQHSSQHMASRHHNAPEPRRWLTTEAANRMIKTLLMKRRTQDALEVVRKLEAAGEEPNTVTVNTFLGAARMLRDPGTAVAAIRDVSTFKVQATSQRSIKLNERSYGRLFAVAWFNRYLNMCRVIWRYACCAGEVRYGMQELVWDSLMSYVPPRGAFSRRKTMSDEWYEEAATARTTKGRGKEKRPLTFDDHANDDVARPLGFSRNDIFHGLAGKFIVGISAESLSYQELWPKESELLGLLATPRALGSPTEEEKEQHMTRRSRLKQIFDADLNEAFHLRPAIPFAEKLEEAWEKDRRWFKRGLGWLDVWDSDRAEQMATLNERGKAKVFAQIFEEMLFHGVKVPMKAGGLQGLPPGWEKPKDELPFGSEDIEGEDPFGDEDPFAGKDPFATKDALEREKIFA